MTFAPACSHRSRQSSYLCLEVQFMRGSRMHLTARLPSQSLLTCSQVPGEHPLISDGGPPAPRVQVSPVPDVICVRAPCARKGSPLLPPNSHL